MQSVLVYSRELSQFDFGHDHPYKPERAIQTVELCTRYGVLDYPWMQVVEPQPADPEVLAQFHDTTYLDLLQKANAGEVVPEMLTCGLGTPDNPILPGIYDWSLRAVGGTMLGATRIVRKEADLAFNLLGGFHHAKRNRAEGFCYVNDVGIVSRGLLDQGIRLACVDIDVHHCNGIQEAFYDDDRLLLVSFHEAGDTLYPGTGHETEIGEGKGLGYTVNVPLRAGTDDEVYLETFREVVPPLVSAFSPDILVVELGADAQISDPLAHLNLTTHGYEEAVRILKGLCDKILALGGGGYDVYRTARCWTLAWSALNGVEPEDQFAGVVGGMMFGPEHKVGSIRDQAHPATGQIRERALTRARKAVVFIQKEVFPLHGIRPGA